jgi:hypothetical protein
VKTPLFIHVTPATTQIPTAATPAAKTKFEVIFARQKPNVPDITNIATMNAVNTCTAHAKSLNPRCQRAICRAPDRVRKRGAERNLHEDSAPTVALEAVAAAPQPSSPASTNPIIIAAANHMSPKTANPAVPAAIKSDGHGPCKMR